MIRPREVPEYARSWSGIADDFADLRDVTREAEEYVRLQLGRLAEELGESFPNEAWKTQHPIVEFTLNRVPWTRMWLARLGEAMWMVRGSGGYQQVKERLRLPTGYSEAASLIEAAGMFSRAGFVLAFEPEVIVRNRSRKADLLLTEPGGGELLYVEVTSIAAAQAVREASITINT